MNTASHILMGRFLCRYAEENYGVHLEETSFVLGNVLPDYCPSFLVRHHYLDQSGVHVQRMIRHLEARQTSAENDRRCSLSLGIICHFYADFFCYAHSDRFTGSFSEHMEYESALHRYFQENRDRLGSVRFIAQASSRPQGENLYSRFEGLHDSYLQSQVSFGNDLLYAMMACIDLIVLSSGCAEEEDRSANALDHLEAI